MAMPGTYLEAQRSLDCYMIVEPRRAGPTIGYLSGAPITEIVIDLFGRRFAFAGIAPRKRDGRYDTDSFRAGEFVVEPGLLYRMDSIKKVRQKAPKNEAPQRNHDILPADVAWTGKGRNSRQELDFVVLYWLGVTLAINLLFQALNTG